MQKRTIKGQKTQAPFEDICHRNYKLMVHMLHKLEGPCVNSNTYMVQSFPICQFFQARGKCHMLSKNQFPYMLYVKDQYASNNSKRGTMRIMQLTFCYNGCEKEIYMYKYFSGNMPDALVSCLTDLYKENQDGISSQFRGARRKQKFVISFHLALWIASSNTPAAAFSDALLYNTTIQS